MCIGTIIRKLKRNDQRFWKAWVITECLRLYVVGQLSSRTRHCVFAVAALNKRLSMVWWRWHISVSQLCWSMAVSFWVASITVCVLVCRRESVASWITAAKFLDTKQITVLEHPAYSLDLASSDFFLFPKIKEILKWRHFDDIDDIRNNTTAALKAIPQNQFQNCFERWTRR